MKKKSSEVSKEEYAKKVPFYLTPSESCTDCEEKEETASCVAAFVCVRSLLYCSSTGVCVSECALHQSLASCGCLLFYSEIGVRTEISTVLLNESDAVILNPGDHVLALFHLSRRKISERADFGFLLMKKWKNRGTVIFFPTSR